MAIEAVLVCDRCSRVATEFADEVHGDFRRVKAELRDQAAKAGWLVTLDDHDICPSCICTAHPSDRSESDASSRGEGGGT